MKNKVGRPKQNDEARKAKLSRQGLYAADHYCGIQIRKSTREILDVYCNEQRKVSGLKLSKVDIIDIAIRQIAKQENFFQFAIDLTKNTD